MRLRLTFALHLDDDDWRSERLVKRLPIELRAHETTARLQWSAFPGLGVYPLLMECPIERPEEISAVESTFMFRIEDVDRDDPRPVMMIECRELDLLALRAEEIAGAIAMLTGSEVRAGTLFGEIPEVDNRLIPESEPDERVLSELGQAWVLPTIRGESEDTTLGAHELTGDLIGRLAERPGIRLYLEARQARTPIAAFRELWRTLEMALGAQNLALLDLLADHPATQALGFDQEELQHHLALRNRASHAGGRAASEELQRVHQWCVQRVGRLHALVEGVLADDLVPLRDDRALRDFNRQLFERPVKGAR